MTDTVLFLAWAVVGIVNLVTAIGIMIIEGRTDEAYHLFIIALFAITMMTIISRGKS